MLRAVLVGWLLAAAPLLAAEPIHAVYVTGGGWHDYKALAPVVTGGIGKHTSVEWDVHWAPEALRDKQLAEKADVLVYNFCIDNEEPAVIERLLDITRAGKPTVMLHCSMHCFRMSDAWTDCCGQRTRKHDAYRAFSTRKADPQSPILKNFPDAWQTSGDELYQTIELAKDSHPLLLAKGEGDRENVVCWWHTYGKGRVFATTLGHDMKTASQDDYHRLVASGLLWACDKLDDAGNPQTEAK